MDKIAALRRHFGHGGFRPGQEELADALLAGRDVLGVMPTGAGKSVCYQLPALLLPGVTLVISPLISLMKDQVAALAQVGVAAAYINSSLTAEEYRHVLSGARRGAYKILYVAPERLTAADFLRLAEGLRISLIAVDEAHCVSQWGQDFRPSYLKIAAFVSLLPNRPVIGAFTATATAQVKTDVERLLLLQNPLRVTTGFDRANLFFEVVRPKSKDAYLLAFLASRREQSGIVYCATRKTVEAVWEKLRGEGIAATRYHAGLEDAERKRNQEDFAYDRARVMVATNAFGMGIDKSNVSFVAHYNMPKNIESYYQEAGRAGRDGAAAHCVLLFSAGDIQTAKFLIHNAQENEALSEEEHEAVRRRDLQRLDQMTAYCKTAGCLRAHLLHYFGEITDEGCGSCGNCNGELVDRDITVEAQKILSAVARVEKKYASGLGLTLIIRMLCGSEEQRVIQLGLHRLPTYGIMKDTKRTQIRDYIDFLTGEGYLRLEGDEYPVLRLAERARGALFDGERVRYLARRQGRMEKAAAPGRRGATPPTDAEDGVLLTALKALRTKIAQAENVPAYIVFSNVTLADMAAKAPSDMAELLQVTGVGEVKAARYGRAFLEELRNRREEADGESPSSP